MNKFKSRQNPSLFLHTRDSLFQEFQAWWGLLKSEWYWVLILIAGALLLLAFTRPLPPRDVYLAVGQEGSTFEALGQKFVPLFAQENIRLHLVNTSGSASSLKDLADKNIQVNAALMVSGIPEKDKYPDLNSLGSIEYVPLWLFYHGDSPVISGTIANFSNKKVAIGPEGSGTEIILERILSLSNVSLDKSATFLKIPNKEAAEKLISGEVDAVFILDGINGPNVKKLLAHDDVHVFNFEYAKALAKKLPYLEVVEIPKGSLDLKNLRPPKDISMLSSTVSLLVEKDMHPAVQYLFLLGAEKISNNVDQFFAKPDLFPAYLDRNIPLSPVANRFYEKGAPALKDSLPLWLSSYLDRIWILLIGALAVIYPMFKLFPSYRHTRAAMLISDAYQEILEIEQQADSCESLEILQKMIDRLEEMNADSRRISISSDDINRLYSMKSALNMVHAQLLDKKSRLDP
ncbi:MAG: TAXI family TRAP transporter solute-binding subunit [Sheuella sp.]|nr:TAXI family TRAP transporter solute-binding subunit [Sheuella sp.]